MSDHRVAGTLKIIVNDECDITLFDPDGGSERAKLPPGVHEALIIETEELIHGKPVEWIVISFPRPDIGADFFGQKVDNWRRLWLMGKPFDIRTTGGEEYFNAFQ